jgi:hypothetical protein
VAVDTPASLATSPIFAMLLPSRYHKRFNSEK